MGKLVGLRTLAAVAGAVFVTVTVLVSSDSVRTLDARAFRVANDLRAHWLDDAARVVTTLGLLVVVGPIVLLGAALLFRRRHRVLAAALVAGAALTWIAVWISKSLVDRSRPPFPLVHTSGQSYPSAHAANAVGWLALAIALTAVIPTRRGRIAAITLGTVLTVVVGLSRVYLRAHYLTDVVGGEALAVAMYALAALAVSSRWRGLAERGRQPEHEQ